MAVSGRAPHRSDLDRALAGEAQLFNGGEDVTDIAPERAVGPMRQAARIGEVTANPDATRRTRLLAVFKRLVRGGRAARREPHPDLGLDTLTAPRVSGSSEAEAGQASSGSSLRAATTAPGIGPDRKGEDRRTIGIVFVHGIGSQLPDQILIEWASPLVRAISAWQEVNHDDLVGALARTVRASPLDQAKREPPKPEPLDPVAGAQMDFVGDTLPVVRLNIPGLKSRAGDEAGRRQTWLITESWWASRVEPPSFATMVDWCGRQGIVARVVQSIAREDERKGVFGRLERAASSLGLGLFLSTLSTLALIAFGLLQTVAALVPIDAVKNATVFAQFDTFLTTWWGDTYVLLRSPIEAANIRGRLAEAIVGLRKMGADAIVVIAHSGGTIVSYTTLSDPALARMANGGVRADLLVTHGEAINLARNLTSTLRQSHPGAASVGGFQATSVAIPTADRTSRDGIRVDKWIDFWASRDPAPTGPIDESKPPPRDGTAPPLVDNRPVWNRMSVSEDHGTYWDNDEEFVLPVLRQLDIAGLAPEKAETSRFDTYASGGRAADWAQRHQQRVWALAFWRRLTFIVPFGAILLAILQPDGFFAAAANAAGWAWSAVGADNAWRQMAGFVAGGSLQPYIHVQLAFLVLAMTAFGLTLVALVVHSLGGIGQYKKAWPKAAGRARLAELLASLSTPAALGLLILGGRPAVFATDVSCIGLGARQIGPFVTPADLCPTPYALGLLLGIAVAVLLFVALFVESALVTNDQAPAPQGMVVAFGLTAVLIIIVFAILVSFATDEQARIWVVGAVATVLLFRKIDSFGAARWARWDEKERAAARRRDAACPSRTWVAIQAWLILGSALAIALGIATAPGSVVGIPGWDLFGGGILILLVSVVVMVVVDGAVEESQPSGAFD